MDTSATDETVTGIQPAKDHTCPFCGHSFTSSSLGRHLDQFIRDNNPKPADGVHDLDRIRAIRGRITRRRPRASKTGDHESPSAVASPSATTSRTPEIATAQAGKLVAPVVGTVKPAAFNTMGWQATGVINNIPSTSSVQISGQPLVLQPTDVAEQLEIGRAAQLALEQVLASLNAARAQLRSAPLFDFDFFGLSFPALCLQLIPGSTVLYPQTTVVPQDYWSLEPPSQSQLADVKRHLLQTLTRARTPPQESARFTKHLEDTWKHWSALNAEEQHKLWSKEGLRAYARCREREKDNQAELLQVRQQIDLLRKQHDRAKLQQLPPEVLLGRGGGMDVAKELHDALTNDTNVDWDYSSLLATWRHRVRTIGSSQAALDGMPSQQPSTDTGGTVAGRSAVVAPPARAIDATTVGGAHTADSHQDGMTPARSVSGRRGGKRKRAPAHNASTPAAFDTNGGMTG